MKRIIARRTHNYEVFFLNITYIFRGKNSDDKKEISMQ